MNQERSELEKNFLNKLQLLTTNEKNNMIMTLMGANIEIGMILINNMIKISFDDTDKLNYLFAIIINNYIFATNANLSPVSIEIRDNSNKIDMSHRQKLIEFLRYIIKIYGEDLKDLNEK